MAQEQAVAEREALLAQLTSLTSGGSLKWERQRNSAHRYARWNNSLLILGPTASLDDHKIPLSFPYSLNVADRYRDHD